MGGTAILSSSSTISTKEEKIAANKKIQNHKTFRIENFTCPICLNLLYKPSINSTCGHAFCFWCIHHAMGDGIRIQSNCPVCRQEYNQLSVPCGPLHRFLGRAFPMEMKERKRDVEKEEEEEMMQVYGDMKSPEVEQQERKKALVCGGVIDTQDLKCVECRHLVQNPIVPPCGHLVCRDCLVLSRNNNNNNNNSKHCCDDNDDDDWYKCPECDTPIRNKTLNTCTILMSLLNKIPNNIQVLHNDNDDDEEDSNSFFHGKITQKHHKISSTLLSSTTPNTLTPPPTFSSPSTTTKRRRTRNYIHYGIGCDGCGQYPIHSSAAYHCLNCSEKVGYDLCQDCFVRNVHKTQTTGRFCQNHDPLTHKMVLRRRSWSMSGYWEKEEEEEEEEEGEDGVVVEEEDWVEVGVLILLFKFLLSFIGGSWRLVLDDDDDDDDDDDVEEEEEESIPEG